MMPSVGIDCGPVVAELDVVCGAGVVVIGLVAVATPPALEVTFSVTKLDELASHPNKYVDRSSAAARRKGVALLLEFC